MRKMLVAIVLLVILIPTVIMVVSKNMDLVDKVELRNLKAKFVNYGPCRGRKLNICYINIKDDAGLEYNVELDMNEAVSKLHLDKVLLLEVNNLSFESGHKIDCVKVIGYEETGGILYQQVSGYKKGASYIGCKVLEEGTIHGH